MAHYSTGLLLRGSRNKTKKDVEIQRRNGKKLWEKNIKRSEQKEGEVEESKKRSEN